MNNKKSILVADNELDIVESLETMLLPYFQVDIATSGIDTLRLFTENKYDGLILDIDFGAGINGLEVATMIRQKDRKVKILIFSAVEYSGETRTAIEALNAQFIEKPINLSTILEYFNG